MGVNRRNAIGLMVMSLMSFSAYAKPKNIPPKKTKIPSVQYTEGMVNLKTDLRVLWQDHIIWTRNYVISALAGIDDAQKVSERLLKKSRGHR